MGAANSNEPLRVALLGLDAVGDEYTMCLIKALWQYQAGTKLWHSGLTWACVYSWWLMMPVVSDRLLNDENDINCIGGVSHWNMICLYAMEAMHNSFCVQWM